MGIWAAIAAGVFLYVGSRFLFANMVTGTDTATTLVVNIIPVAIAAIVVGVSIRVFKF